MRTWIGYLDRVLRGEATHPDALRNGEIRFPVGGLAVVAVLLGLAYGLCMGSYALFQGKGAWLMQITATTVKVPALFFLTLAVTFPSLYVFNALVGSRLNVLTVLRLLVMALAVMLTILASLGPIVAFFSASTTSYEFMLLLNVAVFGVAGLLGLRKLKETLHRLSLSGNQEPRRTSPPVTSTSSEFDSGADIPASSAAPQPVSPLGRTQSEPIGRDVQTVFNVWIVVFGLVGAQMAWVLRPFLGAPGHAFTLFRVRESSFFEAVLRALGHLF